jgi:O-methyltransferase involved in polyketide biosynthesis
MPALFGKLTPISLLRLRNRTLVSTEHVLMYLAADVKNYFFSGTDGK